MPQALIESQAQVTADVFKAKQVMKHDLQNIVIDLDDCGSQKTLVAVPSSKSNKGLKIYAGVITALFLLSLLANIVLGVYTHRYTEIKGPCMTMASDINELQNRNIRLNNENLGNSNVKLESIDDQVELPIAADSGPDKVPEVEVVAPPKKDIVEEHNHEHDDDHSLGDHIKKDVKKVVEVVSEKTNEFFEEFTDEVADTANKVINAVK
eukprot:Awhi_evm1s15729